jgi:hypothetical protein
MLLKITPAFDEVVLGFGAAWTRRYRAEMASIAANI